jgi:hypothetical protein
MTSQTILILVTLLLAAFQPALAHANVLLRPALSYSSVATEAGDTKTTTTRRLIDVTAGYVYPSGLSLLGLYGMETKTSESGGSSSTDDRKSLGAGLGWQSQGYGPYLAGLYIFDNKLSSGGTNYKGTGMQFDLGYRFTISGLGIGLQMSYRMFTYKEAGGVSLSPQIKYTHIDPMFAFSLGF